MVPEVTFIAGECIITPARLRFPEPWSLSKTAEVSATILLPGLCSPTQGQALSSANFSKMAFFRSATFPCGREPGCGHSALVQVKHLELGDRVGASGKPGWALGSKPPSHQRLPESSHGGSSSGTSTTKVSPFKGRQVICAAAVA